MWDWSLPEEQVRSASWLVGQVCPGHAFDESIVVDDVLGSRWRSVHMARQALAVMQLIAGPCSFESARATSPTELKVMLGGQHQRRSELVVSFEPREPGRVVGFAVLPILDDRLE